MHRELNFKKLQKKKGMKRFQLTNLKVEQIENSYKEKTDRAIMETYDAQCNLSIEEKWGNIKRCILNKADEVLGKKKKLKERNG
ncbi:Hypothetical protein CINCED_3A023824 [Cinara cedri]|uniref:Uncharacterized protein n=1 Tax=Cinara cedri TaxID=506608 RepID=A0A5E4NQX9_9HEMI|nr:Hypothetical protein CINCED_3A023824 [Cinara cedri]